MINQNNIVATKPQTELVDAVKAIKQAILQSQYRAAKSVNCEQLSLYFGVGRFISENSRKGFWGTGAIERISEQLQKELPGLRGFSAANLKFMRLFYEAWAPIFSTHEDKSIAMATDLEIGAMQNHFLAFVNRLPQAIDLKFDEFCGVSFTHHLEILHKTKDIQERVYYIHQTYINSWDK